MLGEKGACAAVSSHSLFVHTVAHTGEVLPATLAAALRLREFQYRVCHVMKIAIAESNPDTGLLSQQTVRLSPVVLTRVNRMTVMSTSVVSDRG